MGVRASRTKHDKTWCKNIDFKPCWFVDLGDFADSMNSSSLKGKQYDMCMTKRTNMDPHTNVTAIDGAHWTSWKQSLGLCIFTGHHLSNLPNTRVHASRHDHALSRWMARKHLMWMMSVHGLFAYFCKRQLRQPLRNEAFKSHINSASSQALHFPLATGHPEKTMFSGVSLVLGAALGLFALTWEFPKLHGWNR